MRHQLVLAACAAAFVGAVRADGSPADGEAKGRIEEAAAARDDRDRERYESIRRELKDLAERQGEIGRATRDFALGKNEAR